MIILDDATTGVKQTDLQFTQKCTKEHEKHPRYIKAKFGTDLKFGLRHYAGDVTYTTAHFIEKNFAGRPPEVLELMRSSGLPVMQELGKDPEEPAPDAAAKAGARGSAGVGAAARGGSKKVTVCSQFRRSLNELITKLATA